jgi:hypothetical protein
MIDPTIALMMLAAKPIVRDTLAPDHARTQRSRPRESVPNQCAFEKLWFISATLCVAMSYLLNIGTKIAIST